MNKIKNTDGTIYDEYLRDRIEDLEAAVDAGIAGSYEVIELKTLRKNAKRKI